MKKERLTIKDYITIGIFTVLQLLVSMVASSVTMPFMTFCLLFGNSVSALLAATVYLLMIYRVGKPGTFLVSGLLQLVLYLVMGFPQMALALVPAVLLAELCLSLGGYTKNFQTVALSWSIYSAIYGLHGAVMLWVFGKSYMETTFVDMFSPAQLTAMINFYYSPWLIFAIIAVTFICGYVGCLVGWRLMKKHFIKAGFVQVKSKLAEGTDL